MLILMKMKEKRHCLWSSWLWYEIWPAEKWRENKIWENGFLVGMKQDKIDGFYFSVCIFFPCVFGYACVCACSCVCVGVTKKDLIPVSERQECVCVCVCACLYEDVIAVYWDVCQCECMYVSEKRDGVNVYLRKRICMCVRMKERKCVSMCVCMWEWGEFDKCTLDEVYVHVYESV